MYLHPITDWRMFFQTSSRGPETDLADLASDAKIWRRKLKSKAIEKQFALPSTKRTTGDSMRILQCFFKHIERLL